MSLKLSISKTKIYFTTFFAILLLIGMIGCSGNSVTPREGSVSGKILTVSGQPIESALVSWKYDNTRWALTDENGNYYIQGIGFGTQVFSVEAFGYKAYEFTAEVYSGQNTEIANKSIETKSFDYLEIEVDEVSATHAVINWKTTDYTNGRIEYGETDSLGRTVREPERQYSTTHSLTITGLSPEKNYKFKIIASRENRPAETSKIGEFTTKNSLEDTTAPTPPAGVSTALTEEPNQVTVFWAPGTDLDLKGYRLYRSELPTAAFKQVSTALIAKGQERYADIGVTPGKKYYYKVTAIDQAGNESGFNNLASMLIPGDIATEVTWTRANSPYVIAGDISILSTGRLNIDPGVEVLIESSDSFRKGDQNRVEINVSGAIVASAGNDLPVVFAAKSPNPAKDSWKGFYFVDVENPANTLVNVTISDAQKGLRLNNSKGIYKQIALKNCETAVFCESSTDLTLSEIETQRCSQSMELRSNKNISIEKSTFIHPTIAISSTQNDGLKIEKCNFLEYIDKGIISDETGGIIEFKNNLFVSPQGLGISLLSQNATIEYNTFDSPYGIQIAQSSPIIRKNIFLAERSVFGAGKKGIEHLVNQLPLPTFGPNNIFGFSADNSYMNCTPAAESKSEDVLLMKDINGEQYDYRLRQAFPDNLDPWGINREKCPYTN